MCPADRHADWPDDPPVQPVASLAAARRLAAGCRRCDLWRGASRTVFGDGADGHAAPSADRSPHLMLVGEQPGIRRIWPAIRSWGRRDGFWIRRWRRPVSTAPGST
ncbi:hypothetical protein ACFQ4K_31980 [Tistrella bauzanensis]